MWLCIVLCMWTLVGSTQNASVHLIPQPVDLQILSGSFLLNSQTGIGYNRPESRTVAEMLAQKLNSATGFALKAENNQNAVIQLFLNEKPNSQLGKEGYTLEVGSQKVVLVANQVAGLFYGVQTLLQLFPPEIESKKIINGIEWQAQAVKITDYPRFGWRGIMLDVSRHFYDKEAVKAYIDQLVRYKMNIFHWHLTDDEGWRIEIKSLPKLTSIGAWRVARHGRFGERAAPKPNEAATYGGFYTQDDIKEIVAYAQARHVTIIPEIDVPGHSMAAIAAYPELSCKKDTSTRVSCGARFSEWYGNGTFKMLIENALNPADEKVYEFLDKVFTEVAALFPAPYIHVGGDECYKGFWLQDAGCQALMKKLKIRHVEDLQGYFMARLEKILTAKGKKLLGWDEILEGGISPGATVMSWRGIKGGIEAAEHGHDVVMSPTTYAYLDYTQGDPTIDPPIYANLRLKKTYSFEPVPEGVNPKYILGVQGNLWTEQVQNFRHIEYMSYPRAWALAEIGWSSKSGRTWENFVQRLETNFKRADAAQVNYSKAVYDPIIRTYKKADKLMLELESEIGEVDIHYTLDESMPDNFSPKYSQTIAVPEGPVNLRVQAYRRGKPIGHLITLKRSQLEERVGKF
ncbi:MAG: family 20 glycosylhydrolase [Microscillaceae bacterium]|nr:family 20 glycosylhydrolase [Microscillaceae bacterium]